MWRSSTPWRRRTNAVAGVWGWSATVPRSCRNSCAAGSPSTSSPTRRRPTIRCSTAPSASRSRTGTGWRPRIPEDFTRARASMARHVEAMVGFMDAGAEVFDYGNSIRAKPSWAATSGPSRSGVRPAYIRPLFCEGRGRSGGLRCPVTRRTSRSGSRGAGFVPGQRAAASVDHCRPGADRVPGTARSYLLAGLRRTGPAGLAFNDLVASGEVSAPIAIGRDHLTAGRSPRRIARPKPCSTAPTPSRTGRCSTHWSTPPPGASWVSIHHGGGVGIGRSIHAGTGVGRRRVRAGRRKLARVLTNDPGME